MSSVLRFIKLRCPHVFSISLPWFSPVIRSNSKIARTKLVSLSLLPLYFQKKVSKEGQLSDPNFVQGLSFIGVLILACRTALFDAIYRTRRKIVQYFDQECERYQNEGQNGLFSKFYGP